MFNISTKTNQILLFILVFLLPIYLYYYYTSVSEKTYQKDYYLIKSGDPEYIERINLQDSPIINENSIKEFIEYSMIRIFNYRPNVAIRNLSSYQRYFGAEAFRFFSIGFAARIQNEIDSGIVINEAIIVGKPLYMGSYYRGGNETRIYYLRMREMKTGETGIILNNNMDIFIEIAYEDFMLNQTGLSIRSILVR